MCRDALEKAGHITGICCLTFCNTDSNRTVLPRIRVKRDQLFCVIYGISLLCKGIHHQNQVSDL